MGWSDRVTNDLYRKLEIAPVEVVGEAVSTRKDQFLHQALSASSMEKFERACEVAKADGI